MSAAKSSMIMAFLALFVCLSSTVMAAELIDPGNPFNCTTIQTNCRALGVQVYGTNATFNGANALCNVTNISNAKPLCGINVVCTATFLVQVAAPAPGASSSSAAIAVPTATANGTTTTTTTIAPVPTQAAAVTGSNFVYTIASADLTPQLLAEYNQDHCPKSAANAKMATSVVAMIAVASVVSFVSALL
ncbi:hypothetical protein EC957_009681 [Mortierella hygrophila]|uniref:Uncharacterized protein n=1 Tax=Mortierella hygrophila TaxID=979708 RepID=A0A9P6FAW9_9FUNG|nr:hypothetical protein EC957_009681 [Mortierella hygrophila]